MGSASSCFLSTKPQDEGERSFRSMNDSLRPNITALSTKDIYLIRSSWRGLETCNSLRQPNCSSFKMNSSYVKDRFQGLFFSKLFCHSPVTMLTYLVLHNMFMLMYRIWFHYLSLKFLKSDFLFHLLLVL